MENQPIVVLCTTPDQETAHTIAEKLVESGLAACCNIVPAIQSVYRWQGKIEKDNECLLIIKSSQSTYPDLEKEIISAHPYDAPEVLALQIVSGSKNYLDWLFDSLR